MQDNTEDDFISEYLQQKAKQEKGECSQLTEDQVEVQALNQEYEQLEDEAVRSTRKALHQAHVTQDVGEKALTTLSKQTEKLASADSRSHEADRGAELNYATSKKVKKHGYIFGFSPAYFFHGKKSQVDKKYAEEQAKIEAQKASIGFYEEEHQKMEYEEAGKAKSKGKKNYKSEKDKEMYENLDQLDHVVSNLKLVSEDMNTELSKSENIMESIENTRQHAYGITVRAERKIEKFTS